MNTTLTHNSLLDLTRIESLNSTLGVHNLLTYYQSVRVYILQLLKSNPKLLISNLWGQILSVDGNCKHRFGRLNETISSYTSCAQCTMLSRVAGYNHDISQPVNLTVGAYSDSKLELEEIKTNTHTLSLSNAHVLGTDNVRKYYKRLAVCDSNPILSSVQYLISDPVSHNLLTHIILNDIVPQHIYNLESTYVCNNNTYNLYRSKNSINFYKLCNSNYYLNIYNNISHLKPEYIKSILSQLTQFYKSLSAYNYTHNNCTVNSTSFNVKNTKNVIATELQFRDFYYSTLEYGNLKLLNNDLLSQLYYTGDPFLSNVETLLIQTDTGSRRVYSFNYTLGKQILHYRRLGINLYTSSLDIYTFLISAACNSVFYNGLLIDDTMYTIWKNLWTENDFPVITNRLLNIHQNILDRNIIESEINVLTALELLSDLYCRCDVLEYLILNL